MAQRLGGAVDGDNAVVFSLIKFLDEIFQYLIELSYKSFKACHGFACMSWLGIKICTQVCTFVHGYIPIITKYSQVETAFTTLLYVTLYVFFLIFLV